MKKAEFKPKLFFEADYVNTRCDADPEGYIAECEQRYEDDVAELCKIIAESGRQIVMVSGPSSSGKTTSAGKLAQGLSALGRRASVVSLDNFFKNIEDYPVREDGEKDYESPYALDIEEFRRCMEKLLATGFAQLPTFDFPNQCRAEEILDVDISDGGLLIIEGIHALNPLLTQQNDRVFKLYAGLRVEYSVDGEPFLKTREVRIIRRIIRDYLFRGFSAQRTLSLWDSLQEGENKWIKVFKPDADLLLNTSFGYEACIYSGVAQQLFESAEHGGEYREILLGLIDKLEAFVPIDSELMPKNSMLREFVG